MAGVAGHIYMTAHGHWRAGPWVGESAQIGMRFTAWGPGENLPYVELPFAQNWTSAFDERTTTNFNVSAFWDAPMSSWMAPRICDDLAEDMLTFLTAIKTYQTSNFEWTTIKQALVERGTGKYLTSANIYELKSPLLGQTNTQMLPPEVSIAVSFRSPVVGRRGRGRLYVPALLATAASSLGETASNVATAYATAAKALVANVGDLPGLDLQYSGLVIGSGASTSMIAPREVRVGNHMDVQRRRQHQVDESYTVMPV